MCIGGASAWPTALSDPAAAIAAKTPLSYKQGSGCGPAAQAFTVPLSHRRVIIMDFICRLAEVSRASSMPRRLRSLSSTEHPDAVYRTDRSCCDGS